MKGLFAARWSLALFFLLGVAWAMTPAGTVIRNQASAEVAGQRYLSNVVETVVQALCVPVVRPDGTPGSPAHSVVAPAGGVAYLAYQLQNAGNAPFDFSLSWAQAGGDFAPSRVRFFLDVNGNARPDPGEPEIRGLRLEMGQTAGMVMEVTLPLTASGEVHLTPVLSCEGAQDADNYARITATSGPALEVAKSVSPARLSPGEVAEFSLVLRNAGDQVATDLVLSDLLGDGLDYVAGSARATKGQIEYTGDGVTWQENEPAQVKGLRLRLSKLEPGEEARLSFRVRGRRAGAYTNRAEATGPGGPAWAEAVLEVLPGYAHHLGPLGNPQALPGGEGSEDDQQTAPLLVVGQPYCFAHTLENAGEADDEYTLEASGLPEGVVGWFETMEGLPLGSPLPLARGFRLDFRYCLRADRPLPPFTVVLSAKSKATGSSNRTWDKVQSTKGPEALRLEKRVSPEGIVAAGDILTYTLRIENTLADLEGVRVVDRLDPALEFVSASDGGSFDPATGQVVWNLGDLPLGSTRTLTLKVRVREGTPDDTLISNRFSLTSTLTPNPLESNTVQNRVFSASLLLQKSVSPPQVGYGDRLTYRLEVANPSTADLEVRLVDTPPAGTQYIPGSARLYEAASGCTGAHQPLEPTQEEGKLVWSGIRLEAGKKRCLTYELRVLPGAPETLLNTAQAFGTTQAGTALASAQAKALARLVPGPLDRQGTLVGRVFLDRDRDGRYTPGLDTPLPGARVILGSGLQALTDTEGRYAFRDLVPGVWILTLDRASAPFRPLPHPEAQGDGYTHRVRVEGLAVSDFPLEAPQGTVGAIRSTVLEFGPLRLEKRLIPLPKGFRVVLRLEAREPLPDLTLTDPLPGGGEKVFKLGTFEGQRELFYEVEQGILTDPQVRWRYP